MTVEYARLYTLFTTDRPAHIHQDRWKAMLRWLSLNPN